ncbi:hypothetical protein B0T13DRAFT_491796 [Neurospora crassa]|nr:hypothetical protein B0T13DRAFT_491796 [Neurospora crassa]
MALYRTTGKLSAVMGQAKYHAAAKGGGTILEIPACAVTADELKQELQRRLQTSQYTIQVSVKLLNRRLLLLICLMVMLAETRPILGHTATPWEARYTQHPLVMTTVPAVRA